jgi:hypothetical protein
MHGGQGYSAMIVGKIGDFHQKKVIFIRAGELYKT